MVEVKINLKTKLNNPTLVVGFPGFGLVGVIATEFLYNHLNAVEIGKYWFEDLPATVAIHDSKIVNPVGIFYDKKNNIVIVHSISAAQGIEWAAADVVADIADKLNAKEVICLDGVGIAGEQQPSSESRLFFYASDKKTADAISVIKMAAKPEALKESIVMGVTPAVILKSKVPVIAVFAEVQSKLPDSKAAARTIQFLDAYLKVDLDYKPLIDAANKFEEKVKKIVDEHQKIADTVSKKDLSYFG